MLTVIMPDSCCEGPLNAAVLAGLVDAVEEWECPECGCRWKARLVGDVARYWEPSPVVAIVRRR